MKSTKILSVAAISGGFAMLTSLAAAALSSPTESHVTFQALGTAGLSFEGTTSDLTLNDSGDNVVITIPLANLSTGIALRDRHMKEKYLEVQKYPSASLSITRSALKLPAGDQKLEADATTSVTLHGQTHPVLVHYEIKNDGANLAAYGKFHINMNEFGITVPSYLGVTVKPDVNVSAKFRVSGR